MSTSRTVVSLAAALLMLASATPLRAQTQPSDSAAVVAVVQRLFDAMATKDTALARSLIMPSTRFVSMLSDTTPATPRAQADTMFLRSLVTGSQKLLERMWAPVVHVQGPLAILWAPYDFHVDGRFSHCGIDTATLVRGRTGWMLTSLAYTVQRRGCAPSPLGAPKGGE
ncbi:MAG: nuclear transport factor 2 family protein [Gemmatimonadota bacterium]